MKSEDRGDWPKFLAANRATLRLGYQTNRTQLVRQHATAQLWSLANLIRDG